MKTRQNYFHLIETLFVMLFFSFSMTSCVVEELTPEPPESDQTVFMYLPWSSNLTSFFYQNIDDFKSIIGKNILKNERVIVYMCTSGTKATLSELSYEDGEGVQKTLKTYDYSTPQYTTAEGITSILNDVKSYAPAKRFAMTIGCHGLGWIPKSGSFSRSNMSTNKMHWEYEDAPMTRFFGGLSASYQTDITTLAKGIKDAGLKMEYILFDDCYMSTVEVAYDLKDVTKHLIACTSEIMAYGMPYDKIGQYLIGNIDYKSICDGFYDFYSTYTDSKGEKYPYGTIGITDCTELDNLAAIMKRINQQYTFDSSLMSSLQILDGYSPSIFFDYGDYVSKLCKDPELLEQFREQLERTVPYKRNTDYYFTAIGSNKGRAIKIDTFSGITISDISSNSMASSKEGTTWYNATH